MLAEVWLTLGNVEEAQELLSAGLGNAGQNEHLKGIQWLVLLVQGRLEEAELSVREHMADAGPGVSKELQHKFNLQLGVLALLRDDPQAAHRLLGAAYNDDAGPGFNTEMTLAQSLAALAANRAGNSAAAESELNTVDRLLKRARINGVDHPQIYYSEAALLAMRGDAPGALKKLEEAYERGFRSVWLISLDGRLDSIRSKAGFVSLKTRMQQDLEHAQAEIRRLDIAA